MIADVADISNKAPTAMVIERAITAITIMKAEVIEKSLIV